MTWADAMRGILLAAAAALALAGPAQPQSRAEPVTGPGVITIGNIAPNARVNLRSGPAAIFPVVATLGYGTRVRELGCIGGGAARWCRVQTADGTAQGFVSAQFLVTVAVRPPTEDDLLGGPDFWAVRGLPAGERLNVRAEPTARSATLATLAEGEVVRNLGCQMTGDTRWCRIRSTAGVDVTGWVAARFLRESGAPPAAGGSGPDRLVVTGLPAGEMLNLRTEPSTRGAVLATLREGTVVGNLGCRQEGTARWCRIRTTGGVEVTGWANARYLR